MYTVRSRGHGSVSGLSSTLLHVQLYSCTYELVHVVSIAISFDRIVDIGILGLHVVSSPVAGRSSRRLSMSFWSSKSRYALHALHIFIAVWYECVRMRSHQVRIRINECTETDSRANTLRTNRNQ